MLDNEDGISQIAKVVEDFDEPVRITGVQTDGRLVENVKRADQARAERSCQLYALGLASGQSRGQSVQA